MGLFSSLKGAFTKMFSREDVTKAFGLTTDVSSEMMNALEVWHTLFTRSCSNLPSVVAGEAARLATVDMHITFSGGERADYLQRVFNQNKDRFRSKLELGCAYGGLILKPTATGIDFIPAFRYLPIEYDSNGNITAVVFVDSFTSNDNYYTRLEYHHFELLEEGSVYVIENKAFLSKTKFSLGRQVDLGRVSKWAHLEPITYISGVDRPLFGYFRTPIANNIDIDSPLGVSIFSKAVDSLRDFDMAYDKWRREIKLSDKVLFVDEQAMMKPSDGERGGRAVACNPIPELVRGLRFGNNASKCIEEYNPTLRVNEFKQTLQTQLDLISVQCGFSAGYFSFDEKTGAVTATQIESNDQRTISTCTDIQQNYKLAIEGLVYAMEVYLTLYDLAPEEEVNTSYYMRDLGVNVSEDRDRAYQLAQNGFIPKWKYLVDYEGYSEEKAKEMVSLAKKEAEADNADNDDGKTQQDAGDAE